MQSNCTVEQSVPEYRGRQAVCRATRPTEAARIVYANVVHVSASVDGIQTREHNSRLTAHVSQPEAGSAETLPGLIAVTGGSLCSWSSDM